MSCTIDVVYPSGENILNLSMPPSTSIHDVRRRTEDALGKQVRSILNSTGDILDIDASMSEAGLVDHDVLTVIVGPRPTGKFRARWDFTYMRMDLYEGFYILDLKSDGAYTLTHVGDVIEAGPWVGQIAYDKIDNDEVGVWVDDEGVVWFRAWEANGVPIKLWKTFRANPASD